MPSIKDGALLESLVQFVAWASFWEICNTLGVTGSVNNSAHMLNWNVVGRKGLIQQVNDKKMTTHSIFWTTFHQWQEFEKNNMNSYPWKSVSFGCCALPTPLYVYEYLHTKIKK